MESRKGKRGPRGLSEKPIPQATGWHPVARWPGGRGFTGLRGIGPALLPAALHKIAQSGGGTPGGEKEFVAACEAWPAGVGSPTLSPF